MQRRAPLPFFVLTAIICFTQSASSASLAESGLKAQPSADAYYNRHAEGWYWYQDPEEATPAPPVAKAESTPKKEEKRITEDKAPEPLPSSAPTSQKPSELFSAKWLRENLEKYRDVAITNPTPDNVKAYMLLQRLAMDRAQKFAQVTQQVVIGNPMLDETFRRPLASFGAKKVDWEAGQQADRILLKIAQKAGIFFFFKSDCRYCIAEAPLVKMLEDNGFDVLAISIDGGTLPNATFKKLRMNNGQAEALGLSATPATFLVSPDGRFENLGEGLFAYPELRSRILITALRRGWITQAEFDETRPIINPQNQIDLSKELPRLLAASANPAMAVGGDDPVETVNQVMASGTPTDLADDQGFIEPSKLVAIFETPEVNASGTISPELVARAQATIESTAKTAESSPPVKEQIDLVRFARPNSSMPSSAASSSEIAAAHP